MSIQKYQTLVSDALTRLDWSRDPRGLYAPIAYTLSVGGKRLRPALTLIAAEMYGTAAEKAMPVALALEIFHNFTLLHDDLMDNAPTRRGQATAHKKWSKNAAILSGDAMLIAAYQQLQEAKISDADYRSIMQQFSTMAEQICQGQQYDMEFEQRDDVTVSEYINMIRLKTSVLLATALTIGATLAHAPQEHINTLYKFGINVGIAFQLKDDYLDVYAQNPAFGKQKGGDIINNKKTYLLLKALDLAKGEIKNQLEYWLQPSQKADETKKIEAITSIYNQLQVPQATEQLIEKYTNAAIDNLRSLQNVDTAELAALTNMLLNRTK